jgi:hypothetical protein
MSDIGLDWGPFDIAMIALTIGAPGLAVGAAVGVLAWRRHRLWGVVLGAVGGLLIWLAGFVLWKASPWG